MNTKKTLSTKYVTKGSPSVTMNRFIKIFAIGCLLDIITMLVYTNCATKGGYFFFGLIISICTLVMFNTCFLLIMDRIKMIDLSRKGLLKIVSISFITLIIPSLLYKSFFKYCYDCLFVNTVNSTGIIHKHSIWFDPITIHFYFFVLVFCYYCIKTKFSKRCDR